jgi:hypothetical protein
MQCARAVALVLALAAPFACETSGGGPGQPTTNPGEATPGYGLPQNAVTLVNLHPDEERGLLYSTNYQQLGLISRCTPIRIDSTSKKGIVFTVTGSNRQYNYLFHDTMVETPEQHLARYFGATCGDTSALNPLDLKGIETGTVSEGMTKQGVIYALGYPPEHATPSPDRDQWVYWKNRWDRFVVRFEGGVVASVQN